MENKHFNNISKECEGIFNYVSPKIKIDEEWYIKVIENIGKGEILMKGEEVYEAFGFNQPTILNIIGKP